MQPVDHLKRAKAHLAGGKLECLLYAALEFRLCVESRLLEYSEFAAQFRKNKSGTWKAKDLADHVDGTYAMKPAVYSVEISGEGIPEPITLRYVPVSRETINLMGRCDNFLHAAGVRQLRDESRCRDFRDALVKGIENMEVALGGAMSGPLVRGPDNLVKIVIDADQHPEMIALMKAGMPVDMRIEVTELVKKE